MPYLIKKSCILTAAAAMLLGAGTANAAKTDIANAPLVTSASSVVLPNILFILDDSGSMAWDYLPDHVSRTTPAGQTPVSGSSCRTSANNSGTPTYGNTCESTQAPFRAKEFNSIYYNPAITYTPPIKGDTSNTSFTNWSTWTAVRTDGFDSNSSTIDLTKKYPDVAWCTSATDRNDNYTDCLRNDNYLLPGKLGNKVYNNQVTVFATGTSGRLVSGTLAAPVITENVALGPHYYTIEPGEYCTNTGMRDCQQTANSTYTVPSSLRWCKTSTNASEAKPANGNCQALFSSASNREYKHARYPTRYTNSGRFVRTDIVSTRASYPKAATRTDCAGTNCSYAEEMTNFANWYSYYRTRIQMMKSSASLAFAYGIDQDYRVGFAHINAGYDADGDGLPAKTDLGLNIAKFDATVKQAWYNKLFEADPLGGTPLQKALARAGRLYAGKTGLGNGGADPVQYSCQQNFTILSSDGYWNNGSGVSRADSEAKDVDGNKVENQDGNLPKPYWDGKSGSTGGTSNNLADIAAYYYNTDLRTSGFGNCKSNPNVCENNVPTSGLDTAAHQHMTTFTVGLGIPGFMQYQDDYETATSGDFFSVKNGVQANAANGTCSWQTSGGACTWPDPTDTLEPRIDDLWHAAVNGRGKYYSADNPAALRAGLSDALAGISVRTGTAAAATASNPNVIAGDNFIFSSTFESVKWTGQLIRQTINVNTGAVSNTIDWSARDQLNSNASRRIFIFDSSDLTDKLEDFTWANLDSTQQAYFNTPHINGLSQLCSSGPLCVSSSAKSDVPGANLVNFLRGDQSKEGDQFDSSTLYRDREHVLGDIVNSEPVYVRQPLYSYADTGYADFKSQKSGRAGTVYVAANDGMLHAFNAENGAERWAYIPTVLMPKLYKLADKDYSHEYFVDGSPTVGDVYINNEWRTILVGGLNNGGRSYYALDITDPAAPKGLWEFSSSGGTVNNANLGFSFGRPEITKLKNGKWVVIVTSGYNNVDPGDGKGRLFVLNAGTGAIEVNLPTSAGSAGTDPNPAGLAQIRAWVDNTEFDNTVQRVYGGDLLGNLWRFDVNSDIAGDDAHKLATLGRPITSRPQLGDVSGTPMVYIGTGRYLGQPDLTSSGTDTIYAIKDRLDATEYGNPKTYGNFVQQTLTSGTCPTGSPICTNTQSVRTNSNIQVNLATQNGWYVDLPVSGERSVTDSDLQLGTLAFTTNIPAADACSVGGSSFINFFDYRNGNSVATSQNVTSVKIGNALSTRPVMVRLPNNKVLSLVRLSDGTTVVAPTPVANIAGSTRRLSWRELRTQ